MPPGQKLGKVSERTSPPGWKAGPKDVLVCLTCMSYEISGKHDVLREINFSDQYHGPDISERRTLTERSFSGGWVRTSERLKGGLLAVAGARSLTVPLWVHQKKRRHFRWELMWPPGVLSVSTSPLVKDADGRW